jgi:rhamnosyltransferase subunit B
MSTILFANEFGSGFGHVNRLIAIAKRLEGRHKIIFAVSDVGAAGRNLRETFKSPIEVVKGVEWSLFDEAEKSRDTTHTFADAIRLVGYDRIDRLLAASLQWTDLLYRTSPDLIVADWAPTLRLVSQTRVPMIVVGSGYTIPPKQRMLPPARPWAKTVPPSSRAHEGSLLATVNAVRDEMSAQGVDFFADLFQGDRTFVCTIPEFDPYQRDRSESPIWPFNVPAPERELEPEPRTAVFCYFQSDHPALKEVLAALRGLDRRCEIYVRGSDPREIARQCGRKTIIHSRPVDYGKALSESQIIIHHAGLGTSYAALVSGVPQLVMPVQLEQHLTACALEEFGSSKRFGSKVATDVLKTGLEDMLNDPKFKSRALAARHDLDARRTHDPVAQVVEACESLLQQSPI